MRGFFTLVAVCAFAVLGAGCGSSPSSRLYTLSGARVPSAAPSSLSVAVGPIAVPAVVDRPQFVITTGPNQVRLDEFSRWASPLQDNISRVVAENLVAMLGTPRVTQFPQNASASAQFRIAIEVQRFESMAGEAASLDAVWTVRRIQDGKAETGRTAVREPAPEPSHEALAAAHSRALARLSQDIADAVRGMAESRP